MMKLGRLERALRRARPFVHNPGNWADAANIGKRFRVLRHEGQPELIGKEGVCELPAPNQMLRLKFEDDGGKTFEVEIALADLLEILP
jgi:hypothetical protein